MNPPTDWLLELWRSAQQASPFGAMGAVICLYVVWRAYRKSQQDLLDVSVRGIQALTQVERTLNSLLDRQDHHRGRG